MKCRNKTKTQFNILTKVIGSSANTLIQLLRSALGSQSDEGIPADVDWRDVINHAFSQGVAAIAVDGLSKVYCVECMVEGFDALDSPELEALKYEWFGEVFSCEEDYKKYQSAIAQFLKLCREQQVDVLLLKGYGLSLNYPVPSHRPCGDIDIFINDNDTFHYDTLTLR